MVRVRAVVEGGLRVGEGSVIGGGDAEDTTGGVCSTLATDITGPFPVEQLFGDGNGGSGKAGDV